MAADVIVKHDEAPAADLVGEAAGLRWLGEAEASGGISCARVREASAHRLVEECIPTGAPTRQAAHLAGEALARTHAAGADWYGCPPPGWTGKAYAIGPSRTMVVPRGVVESSSGELAPEALSWGAACAPLARDAAREGD